MKETLERENVLEPAGWREIELHGIERVHERERNEAIRRYREKTCPHNSVTSYV